MTNLVQKILSAPLVGARWVGALESVAEEDYVAATTKMEYLSRFFDNKNLEFHLLRGFVEYATSDDLGAVKDFLVSIRLLRESKKYNDYEKKYLECYAAKYGNLANSNLPLEQKCKAFNIVEWDSVNLPSVRKLLKKNFPLRQHPDWIEV